MTYARARLWTGITGVGTAVFLSALGLAISLPRIVFAGPQGGLLGTAISLLVLMLIAAVAMLPFDLLGGYILPRRFARTHPELGAFFWRWLRGVLVLSSVTALSGSVIFSAGRLGGRGFALIAFAVSCLLFLQFQGLLAKLVGRLSRVTKSQDAVQLVDSRDPGFTGGFTGLFPRALAPAAWSEWMNSNQFALLLKRRQWLVDSGVWRTTQALAIGWNTLGFALASFLPGAGFTTLAEFVSTILGFTLWTFLGLLLLPKWSRRATLNVDLASTTSTEQREVWASTLVALDKLQDDEPVRSKELESIFHPIPSLRSRVEALQAAKPAGSALGWHLARTALYLSHTGLSLLPRAVHCNAGRPELWVYMPSDG